MDHIHEYDYRCPACSTPIHPADDDATELVCRRCQHTHTVLDARLMARAANSISGALDDRCLVSACGGTIQLHDGDGKAITVDVSARQVAVQRMEIHFSEALYRLSQIDELMVEEVQS